jgi:DNA-binding NarL/FixJ family response regulator
MPQVVKVTRAQARAARLRVRSDTERGITPDPRMVKIANATVTPETVRAKATVGEPTIDTRPNRPNDLFPDGGDEHSERVVYGSEARATRSVRDETVLRMVRQGFSIADMARALGVAEQEVGNIVDRLTTSADRELREAAKRLNPT